MDALVDTTLDEKVIPSHTRSMKFAISVPDEVFQAVEAQAQKMGISRSQFFADAARQYVERLTLPDRVAEINAILDQAGYDGSDDEELAHYGAAFLRATAGDWVWDDSDS